MVIICINSKKKSETIEEISIDISFKKNNKNKTSSSISKNEITHTKFQIYTGKKPSRIIFLWWYTFSEMFNGKNDKFTLCITKEGRRKLDDFN